MDSNSVDSPIEESDSPDMEDYSSESEEVLFEFCLIIEF